MAVDCVGYNNYGYLGNTNCDNYDYNNSGNIRQYSNLQGNRADTFEKTSNDSDEDSVTEKLDYYKKLYTEGFMTEEEYSQAVNNLIDKVDSSIKYEYYNDLYEIGKMTPEEYEYANGTLNQDNSGEEGQTLDKVA